MQPFGTIAAIMVKAPNLVRMRLMPYRSSIEQGHFEPLIFLAKFQYAHFVQRPLTIDPKTYFSSLV